MNLEERIKKLEKGNKSAKDFCGEQIKVNETSLKYMKSNGDDILRIEQKLSDFLEAYKMVNSEREHNGCNYSIDMEGMIESKEEVDEE